jgi:phage FluMu protein Com
VIKPTNYSEPLTKPPIEVRCPGCTRYLMRWAPNPQTWIEVKCRQCKTIVELRHGTVAIENNRVDSREAVA